MFGFIPLFFIYVFKNTLDIFDPQLEWFILFNIIYYIVYLSMLFY